MVPRRLTSSIASVLRNGALAIGALLVLASPSTAETFRFGVVPQFEPRQLAEIWTPILDELESRTGHEFQMVGSPRIPEFEQDFLQGKFDFAYMNPYHFLKAAEAQDYKALVRDGERKLFGVLVVAKDSGIGKVSDLQGAKIAYPSPNALGASLLMRADLDRIHGIDYEANYVSTHTSAYLNVALGEAQAAGGVMATLNKLDPAIADRLHILYETTRLPPHPIAVHSRVDPKAAEDVRNALIDMAATPEGAEMLSRVPFRSVVAASQDEYDILRELQLEDYWVDD